MEPTAYVSIVKDVVLAGCAIAGATVALRGLNTWNRQLKGQTEYELARRLLRATYKFREAINVVRAPFMLGSEMPEPPEDDPAASSPAKKRWYGTAKAYEKRWEHVSKARSELEAELIEAEVIWGADIRKSFSDLYDLENDLYYSN